jgi:EpsD family peptidyl-prolyl cis-trans isomerase
VKKPRTHEARGANLITKDITTADVENAALIKAYYDANLALFAQRKIYRLQEIAINTNEEQEQKVINYYRKIKVLNDMKTWLDNNNINYHIGVDIMPAEQVPADLLKTLSSTSSGQTFIVELEKGISIMQVTGIELSPRSLDDATQDIAFFLKHQKSS